MTAGPRPSRGLVLGAGGALGAAWMVGALAALQEMEGYDAASVDMLVGTSAGSVLASLLASGVTVDEMLERLTADADPRVGGSVDPVNDALATIPRPQMRPGNLLLAARAVARPSRHTFMTIVAGLAPRGRGEMAPVAALVAEARGTLGWPLRPTTWIVAMNFDTGRRVVFGRAGAPEAKLSEAVMASSAAPGYFPPVHIGSARYVDGGGISMTNADVLLRCRLDQVLVLAPMLAASSDPRRSSLARADRRLRNAFTRRMRLEATLLELGGTSMRVLGPTAADLALMGVDLMNPARRAEMVRLAMDTTREQLSRPTPLHAA